MFGPAFRVTASAVTALLPAFGHAASTGSGVARASFGQFHTRGLQYRVSDISLAECPSICGESSHQRRVAADRAFDEGGDVTAPEDRLA